MKDTLMAAMIASIQKHQDKSPDVQAAFTLGWVDYYQGVECNIWNEYRDEHYAYKNGQAAAAANDGKVLSDAI